MRQLPIILILLVICTGVFMRFVQPKDWNNVLDSLKAPEEKPDVAPEAAPVVKAPGVEYITPNTTDYTHTSHVTDVSQPVQPPPVITSSTNQVFVPPNPVPSQPAWTWTTSDGKVYKNVIIDKVEADRVSIFHDQGSAVIEIYTLPTDIQKQLNFDPDLAAQAIAARSKNAAVSPSP